MAYTSTQAAGAPHFNKASGLISNLIERYRAYRLYRETLNGLNELSNRELADLGLSRARLREVATQAVYG